MIELKKLSNEQLVSELRKCIQIDRENEARLVSFIEEVDRRRLYLEYHHPSLFSFLTKELGLSNASAQLRIDSARLMREAPEVREGLQSGELSLSQLSAVQHAVRQKAKESGKVVQAEVKRNLVQKIKTMDTPSTQRFLLRNSILSFKPATKSDRKKTNRFA